MHTSHIPMTRLGALIATLGAAALLGGLLWLALPSSQAPPQVQAACGAGTNQGFAPHHPQPYPVDSGLHTWRESAADAAVAPAFRETVRVPGAPWLRLRFSAYELGAQSYLVMTSLADGGWQRLDAAQLAQWRHSSAYFNGDAVEVALYVGPGDQNVYFRMTEITVGDLNSSIAPTQPDQILAPQSICGTTDDRVASNDQAVGRIVYTSPISDSFCTGWIVASGAYLTAGHCADPLEDMDILEFQVPSSLADGTVQFADPSDQYAIDQSSVVFHDNGVGDDWAIFDVSPNPNTNLLPPFAQGAFYRVGLASDTTPATVRVTGFGVDGPPPCFGNRQIDGCEFADRNADSETQQTHAGSYGGEHTAASNDVYITYTVDTQPAGSGSPVIDIMDGVTVSVGIHTTGWCTSGGGGNAGTSFANTDLALALRRFPGPLMVYVDRGHPVGTVSGDIFRPWPTVDLGVYFASANSTLSIVRGSYNEAITITKAVTLTAPVGLVTIGQ